MHAFLAHEQRLAMARKAFSLPIGLTQTPTTCRVLPLSRVKFAEGRCPDVARDTKERAEGVERVEPPVEAECELVEVAL